MSMTRHEDGVRHGSTSLLEHSLDYRIFAFIAQLGAITPIVDTSSYPESEFLL